MESITCITPTIPERVEFRNQCCKYVERFRSFSPARRIEHKIMSRGPLAKTLRGLIEDIDTDFIAIIEDDDVYAPDYLEYQLGNLAHYGKQVIGINPTIYYHLKWKSYMKIVHEGRASLFTLVGKTDVICSALAPIVSEDEVPLIDYKLCESVGRRGLSMCTDGYNKAIGIKHNLTASSSGGAHGWGEDRFDIKDHDFSFLTGACGPENIDFYKEVAASL